MSRHAPRLICGLTALMLSSAGAGAQPPQPPQPLLSSAEIVAAVLRAFVPYARAVADIRYDALETDGARGAVTIRDLHIGPIIGQPDCQITAARISVTGLSLWGGDDTRARADVTGLSIANACFGRNATMIAAFTGQAQINLSQFTVEVRQELGSGAIAATVEAIAPGVARIEAAADFDYLAMTIPGLLQDATNPAGADMRPEAGLRGTLRWAHLTVQDQGLWSRLRPMLPPDSISPTALDAMVRAAPGTQRHAVEQGLADALKQFVAEPGQITAVIRPDQPVSFDTTEWHSFEFMAAELLKPRFFNAAPPPPVALIAAPDAGDARATGLALARGQGLPQNTPRAIEILSPLADDPEIALILADLTAATDPVAAYVYAQRAATAGGTGALAALDRIERQLTLPDLLAAQPGADGAVPEGAFASVAALRDAALAHEDGVATPRSYVLAWRLAALAGAAGDGPAQSLMARLDNRFGTDPAWIAARDKAAEQALSDWQAHDLSRRLSLRN